MPTVEELRDLARAALRFGVDYLRANGRMQMMFHLVKAETVEILLADGPIGNNPEAKRRLGEMLRRRVEKGDIRAVMMISDMFYAEITEENMKIRTKLNLNVEEAAAMGLCEKREAVSVTLESPEVLMLLRQEYHRDDKRKTITVVGDPLMVDTITTPGFGGSGNFIGLFGLPRQQGSQSGAAN